MRLIYVTSPLHDIGKVAMPDSVLLKPGPLTDEEFEIMKTHTTHGAETLDAALAQYPSARFLRMARDIAASHHEWYDGTGYPHGLEGEAIPLCGRIVALADVYDALTSRRVYKDAFSHEKAAHARHKDAARTSTPTWSTRFWPTRIGLSPSDRHYAIRKLPSPRPCRWSSSLASPRSSVGRTGSPAVLVSSSPPRGRAGLHEQTR